MSSSISGLSGLARPEFERDTQQAVLPSSAAVSPPRRRWITRVAIPGGVLLGLLLVLAYTGRGVIWPSVPVRVAPVVTKTSAAGPVSGQIVSQAPGWLEADPYAANVAALAEGVVRELLVLEGQEVQAGQVVARLIDEDAKLALARAEAEVQMRRSDAARAKADLDAAQRAWDHPIDLTRAATVTANGVAEAQSELSRIDAEIAAETAELAQIRDEYDRKQRLLQSSAAAEGELAQITLRLRSQEAMLEATRAMRPVQEAKLRQMEGEATAAAESLELRIEDRRALESATAMLGQANAALASAEAMRDEARLRLDRMEIRSPMTGVVQARLVELGSRVMTNPQEPEMSYILRVYDPEKLQARVDIPLADAAKVHVGDAAEVMTEALPDHVFKGVVTRLVHEANIQKNTVQVKVAIEDPIPDLRPEMLIRAKFYASSPKDNQENSVQAEALRMYVPKAAITTMNDGAMSWVVDQARMRASMRRLTLGSAADAEWVEVTEGLRPGDRVILNAPASLREGTKVRMVEDAQSAEVTS